MTENEKDELIGNLFDALIWCSANEDFNVGGKARKGWLKLCRPLLDAKLTVFLETREGNGTAEPYPVQSLGSLLKEDDLPASLRAAEER